MNHVTKKNIVLIIVAALCVSGVFFIHEYVNRDTQKTLYTAENSNLTATTTAVATNSDVDSDGDGLKDWEEVLYGTDSEKKDTDADGTADGTEITAGRNPLVKKTAKVDDHFTALAKVSGGNAGFGSGFGVGATTSEDSTLTGQFGREIFSQYMKLQQSGAGTDKTSQQAVIDTILSNQKFILSPKEYKLADLTFTETISTSSIQNYANNLSLVLTSFAAQKSRDETTILRESVDKNNAEVLKELDPIIAFYKKSLTMLVSLPVPRTIATMHLNIVNGLSGLVFVDESYRQASADPLIALQGLGRSQKIIEDMILAIKAMGDYMSTNKIKFTL
ncbi:MAG: hypothetical protein RIT04_218 [Candidatus Parcubacteria bacterium]